MGKPFAIFCGLGSIFGLLCCFPSLMPVALTSIGAAGLIPLLYKDSVLLPFVAASLLIMLMGLWMMRRAR
jgi:hypothetical protein